MVLVCLFSTIGRFTRRSLVHLVNDGILSLGKFRLAFATVVRLAHGHFRISVLYRRRLVFRDFRQTFFVVNDSLEFGGISCKVLQSRHVSLMLNESLFIIHTEISAIVPNRSACRRNCHHFSLVGLATRYHLLSQFKPCLFKRKFELRQKLLISVFT